MGRPLRRGRYLAAVLLLAAGLFGTAGCGGASVAEGGEPAEGDEAREIKVLAAASLTDAFGELAATFERENPGVEVETGFGASSDVLAQIQQGAPADVFAPADEARMEEAVRDGLVSGDPEIFARNRLVIAVPEGNPAGVESYEDLAGPDLRLVLAEDGVPVAEYAKESLDEANGEYGGGFRKDVFDNVVSREADVRAALNRVALGEADATFCYASDVTPDVRDRVETVEIPPGLNVIAAYPIAALEGAGNPELANEWVELVTGEEGQRVLEEWGFEPAA